MQSDILILLRLNTLKWNFFRRRVTMMKCQVIHAEEPVMQVSFRTH